MSLRFLYYLPVYYTSLLLFAAGGLELSVVCWLMGWLPQNGRTELFFQRLLHWHFALFQHWCAFSRIVFVRYRGFEKWPKGGLVVAVNHPALLDITCLLSRIPEALCIFKPAIRRNPLFGAIARRSGYLGNDGGFELVRRARDKVAAGNLLIVFPEGTRTPPGKTLLPFKRGYLLIAQQAQVPIQLVHITTDSDLLTKGRALWRLPRLPAHVEVEVGPLIPFCPVTARAEISANIEGWFQAQARRAVSTNSVGAHL